MNETRNISRVVVVGGGITAWSTVATLKRRIPSLDIELISTPPARDALADQIISTLPSIGAFHHEIGLSETDTVTRAASGLRLATLIEGFAARQPDFVHAYGDCGAPVNGVPFHQLWLRDQATDNLLPFDRFSPAAEMARAGLRSQGAPEATAYGLQLSLARYGEMMRAYAFHLGVRVREAQIRAVMLRSEDGFIEKIMLVEGDTVTADLFVDCSGPSAVLHDQMGSPFLDWSSWLPCDRVALNEVEADQEFELMDRITALPCGWQWKASSPRRGSVGAVYSSRHADAADLGEQIGEAREIVLNQGRKSEFFVRNCVAIGDAAVTVEPLEWTNLHLVHSQLERLVSMMPGRDCAQIELGQFNLQCAAEADRVRDFLCMHYIHSGRPEEFWKDAATITPPPSLEHTLSMFSERGRLPFYPEETFSRDSWLTVLLGQGFRPRRIDALADLVPAAQAAQSFASMRRSLKSFTLAADSPLPELNPHGIR